MNVLTAQYETLFKKLFIGSTGNRGFRKSAVNMIGAFTGLPSAQINRTIDGLEALYEGETENVLAPLTGAKKR